VDELSRRIIHLFGTGPLLAADGPAAICGLGSGQALAQQTMISWLTPDQHQSSPSANQLVVVVRWVGVNEPTRPLAECPVSRLVESILRT
jgi:hypothetical protein